MSNIVHIIEERATTIGNFLVGRLLPFRQKRSVGPFVFIDHMGPAQFSSTENFDVPPHPHIGLSTLTYLLEGSIQHKDSIGSNIEIKPGEVNWMTAGKGIVHSERTPLHLRQTTKTMHGLQLWVALPKGLEDMEPSFYHAEKNEIPTWQVDNIKYTLIAGECFGKKSPVPVYSPLYFVEIEAKEKSTLQLDNDVYGEVALYILHGNVQIDGENFGEKQLLVANDSRLCNFIIEANSIVYLFGGNQFPEERFIHWNFVSSSKEKIEIVKENWKNQLFPKINGEHEFVPLPK